MAARRSMQDLLKAQQAAGAAEEPHGEAPQAEARPSARDFVAPARAIVPREALKVDVPADLGLLRRLHAYRLEKGVDIRDQVAIAVDEWLTREGY